MKRNAIVRICVYAGLILLLLAVLAVGIFVGIRDRRAWSPLSVEPAAMSEPAVPVTRPVEDRTVLATGQALYDLVLYESPATGSLSSGNLLKGDSVNILEIVTTNGEDWACVTRGEAFGWVQMPLLAVDGDIAASTEPAPPPLPEPGIGTGTAKETIDIRTTPSENAPVLETLEKGSVVTILQEQSPMGTAWAYVQWGDTHGWVLLEHLETESEVPETTVTFLEEGEPGLRKIYESITALDISWPSGEVLIQPGDVDGFEVRYGEAPVDIAVTDKGRLKIHHESQLLSFKEHDLTVTVPMGLPLREVEIETGSASVTLDGLTGEIQELEIDTASGGCTLNGLTVGELELDTGSGPCQLENLTVDALGVDTTSGKVSFTGSLSRLDFEGASGPLTAVIQSCPKKLDLETVSANLDITLPADCGLTLDFEGRSGKLSTDFDTKSAGNSRIYGDGQCKVQIETASGWVSFHQSQPK
ncbi:MAG: DUF4097 family beta strand repeat-containing protein [Eubacteriales bacterium]|nr:DUF4097 family beta strand repeat-containing protein [Eubacteriales bacterium]